MSEKADVSSVSPSLDRSDEGLTLETSAFSLHGDQLTFSTHLLLSHRRSTTVFLETYLLHWQKTDRESLVPFVKGCWGLQLVLPSLQPNITIKSG